MIRFFRTTPPIVAGRNTFIFSSPTHALAFLCRLKSAETARYEMMKSRTPSTGSKRESRATSAQTQALKLTPREV